MVEMELNPKQFRAVRSEHDETFYIAGIGSGKSFVGGAFCYNEARLPRSLGLITAPTSDTLNNSTLPQLKDVWARLGLIEGTHYIIGSMPPKEWNVPKYTNKNHRILTWRWGAYSILDGSENYNKHRGLELDWLFADEMRDLRDGSWEMYRGRMRGKAKKALGLQYKMLGCTTPPDNPKKIQKLMNSRVNVIYGTSYDNHANLPAGYIEGLKERYDELTFKREVLGELVNSSGLIAYYAFKRSQNVVRMDFQTGARTVMCWDFNASANKPMSTGLLQEIGGNWYLTKEFIYKNSNTDEQCRKISEFFDAVGFNGTLEVTGDSAGHRRESNATRSDYAIIEQYFRNFSDYLLRTRPTKAVRDRVAATNAQFRNMAGQTRLFIDERCTKFIEDLEETRWKENGIELDDKDPERTHPSDALSYFPYNYYPIGLNEPRIS